VTAADYEANLEANLLDLLERIKSGCYVAPPARRVYIPKADGSQRPLGIPSFEDKVAQRVIVMVLEAIYEQDFLSCSFGFRPGRSAHQALSALRLAFMSRQGLRWVLDVDISKYYDTIQHHHLRAFLDRRVTDGVIRRMIDKWLKAGVLEDGLLRSATAGTVPPISSLIVLYNAVSLQCEVPCGGEDLAAIWGGVRLTRATGSEEFVPLGSTQPDPPRPGEATTRSPRFTLRTPAPTSPSGPGGIRSRSARTPMSLVAAPHRTGPTSP